MTSTVHPISIFVDLENGTKHNIVSMKDKSAANNINNISRRASFNEEEYSVVRTSSSVVSLSAELVEAVMHDGQYRFTSEKANEVAMWCGLMSFLSLGLVLVFLGLFMALTGRSVV